MSLETDLRTSLSGIAGGRVYPVHLPQTPTYPAITYLAAGGRREWHLTGDGNLRRARIQIDAWGLSYADAKSTMDSARTQIEASSNFKSIPLDDEVDLYEPDTGLYRVTTDFGLWK